jgi:hypothetical protein
MANPIRYDSETFNTILTDINSDPELRDKPDWWKRLIAGLGDTMSIQRNASANQSFLRTSFTRKATADLLELIDYFLHQQAEASGEVTFYLDPATIFPVSFSVSDLVANSQGSLAISSKRYEARIGASASAVTAAFTANAGTDQLTVSHVLKTLDKLRFTTTGTLPTPLAVSTDYYCIAVDATHVMLAISAADAAAGIAIDITGTGSGTHTYGKYSLQAVLHQQESKAEQSIGTSDGSSEWQEFDLPDQNVLADTLVVKVNAVSYTRVTTFVDSLSSDKHYRLFYRSDGTAYVRFGDGSYGEIPPAFDVTAEYAVGGGADSNISSLNRVNIYSGGNSGITGCSNNALLTGGSDSETTEDAKRLAPVLLKARDRFVTVDDGRALSESYPGVAKAAVIKNSAGVLTADIRIVPNGGGLPSAPLKAALDTFLTDRTILEEVAVTVSDPAYNPQNGVLGVHVRTGYLFADVEPYVRLAYKLTFAETGQEILDEYLSNGIDEAVALINTLFSESFTSSDHDAIIALIDNFEPADFGRTYQSSDLLGLIDAHVEGVDYVTVSSPTFPVTQTAIQITQYGTISITAI